MTYRKLGFWSLTAALMLACSGAFAHHSTVMYDMSKNVTLTGEVKEFQWTNPHIWLQLMVSDESGKVVEWSVQMRGMSVLSRTGWNKTSFKPGEKVTIVVHPLRNGLPGGALVSAVDAKGRQIGGDYEDPGAR